MKALFALFFLVLISSNVLSSLGGSSSVEAMRAFADAQCAKYSKADCVFDELGNARTVKSGNASFNCEWREASGRCGVNLQQQTDYYSDLAWKNSLSFLPYYAFFVLIFLAAFAMFLKFGKSKILKIIYSAKFVGALLIFLSWLLKVQWSTTPLFLILILYGLSVVLSIYALWVGTGEQRKVKAAIVAVFLIEILVFLFNVLIGIAGTGLPE